MISSKLIDPHSEMEEQRSGQLKAVINQGLEELYGIWGEIGEPSTLYTT